jgi:hypothetical protein
MVDNNYQKQSPPEQNYNSYPLAPRSGMILPLINKSYEKPQFPK